VQQPFVPVPGTILTRHQVARALSRSAKTIIRWEREGKIRKPFVINGGAYWRAEWIIDMIARAEILGGTIEDKPAHSGTSEGHGEKVARRSKSEG
jgi:hypothetical protein